VLGRGNQEQGEISMIEGILTLFALLFLGFIVGVGIILAILYMNSD
jgi:hypothetical protein